MSDGCDYFLVIENVESMKSAESFYLHHIHTHVPRITFKSK